MDNKDVYNEKENNTTKLKKMFIILIILIIFFLLYGITTNTSADSSLEEQISSYLKEKYPDSDFEIEQFTSMQAINSGIGCDGSYLIEPKNIDGMYLYYYDMFSKLDDVKFNIYLVDDNGKVEIKDSYDTCRKIKECAEKIQDYIILEIGDENSKKSSSYFQTTNLHYYCGINVYIEENFKDILSEDFINKLHSINTYTNNITGYDDNVEYHIFVYDNTGNSVAVSHFEILGGFYVHGKDGEILGEINEYYSGK